MKKDKPVKVSRAMKITATCLKSLSLVFGTVSVILTVVYRNHYVESWAEPYFTMQNSDMAGDPALRAALFFFGAAVLLLLVPVALYLFGKLDLESLLKPYALSVAVCMPLALLFVIRVLIPLVFHIIHGLLGLIAELVGFH